MAEFKISRLRFAWSGVWAPATFYNRDAVVQYNGKMYVCLVPNTSSANFYDDLYYQTPGGADEPYWDIVIEGTMWSGDWQPTTLYSLGNLVRFGGVVYICIEAHTSNSSAIDPTKFDTYANNSKWNNAWTTSRAYGVGDVVKYGGIVYVCTANHTSANTVNLGLEIDILNWTVLFSGIEYKGPWSSATKYKLNDVVKLDANLYITTTGHSPSGTFNSANWTVWLPGEEFNGVWDNATTYQPGDTISYGGYNYVSNTVNNQGNTPSTNTVNWSLLNQGYNLRGDWNSNPGVSYKIGDVVRRGGILFEAIADNSNQAPSVSVVSTTYTASGSSGNTINVASAAGLSKGMFVSGVGFTIGQSISSISGTTIILDAAPDGTPVDTQSLVFTGVNSNYWAILISDVSWKNSWSTTTTYIVGDIVRWQNGTYKCIRNNPPMRPDVDTTNAYWVLYVPHARKNALTTYGDLESYLDGEYSVIPIDPINDINSFTLRATDQTPTWSHINTIPKLYYVSTSGIDQNAEGYGQTWDKPWRTIKYACETVDAGTAYQNAAQLLNTNKLFLTTEMLAWMTFQVNEENLPFTSSTIFDTDKTTRDASYFIDAIINDITREGNSQSVASTLAYFEPGSTSKFFSDAVTEQMPIFIAALERLAVLVTYVISQTLPPINYQAENGVPVNARITQTTDFTNSPEFGVQVIIDSLFDILITALTTSSTSAVPASNAGATVSIMVKTGTYKEALPISVPYNTAIIGDELRSVVVEPFSRITTVCTYADPTNNKFTVQSTAGMADGMPVQFIAPLVNDIATGFGGITPGTNYYIIGDSITETKFSVSEDLVDDGDGNLIAGDVFELTIGTGEMSVYAGDCLKDMFYLRNGTGLRNMTFTGLLGTLSNVNIIGTKRPTGGIYASLDPGEGPNDTRVWIFKRSPYVQNVTAFGNGVTALKIDGNLHNGGNKSIVCNDFTHILSNGIGIWCTGPGALTEAVSVFSYYGYAGYFAEAGGRIRATNGNSSYGTYGVIAEGFDVTETPATGNVFNQSRQTQAQVQSAFGATADLLKINYNNAGSEYDISATNLLKYSNTFDDAYSTWTEDGNLSFSKIIEAPTGLAEAWTFTGTSATLNSGYISQTILVTPTGAFYENVSAVNISGSGINATFDVTVTSTGYVVTVNNPGSGYAVYSGGAGSSMYISGGQLGGQNNVNDCILTVTGLAGSGVQAVAPSGTVPSGSNKNYTLSVYVKEGTASSIDLQGIFAGESSVTSTINYNFITGLVTPSSANGGFTPVHYNANVTLSDGWYRLWFAINDTTGLNNTLEFRLYPKGVAGAAGQYTYFYGAQIEASNIAWLDYEPSFYLETYADIYTSYANFNITGAGTGVSTIGDELRSGSVFQTRVTDPGSGAGGSGYLTASNNGQSGTTSFMQLSQSDNNTQASYTGMRLFINSGTGAGQYGYISAFDEGTKIAQILKESFDSLQVVDTTSSGNLLTLGSTYTTDTLYVDQPIQFIPTYYTTSITSTSLAQVTATAAIGGTTNTLTVSSTLGMVVNMGVTFSGTPFSTVSPGYTYYIYEIVDETTIKITDALFGSIWPLTTASGTMNVNFTANNSYLTGGTANMVVNYPIQFTGSALGGLTVGTVYYINEVHGLSLFSISNSLVEVVVTATNPSNKGLSVTSTSSLIPLNPIIFTDPVVGNITAGTKYYISKIIDAFTFSVSTSLISVSATDTTAVSNLVTVTSTTGFVVNNPIQFVGTTFGNIVAETIYYVLAINDGFTFTISQTPGGGAVALTTSSGLATARTAPTAFAVTSSSGASMPGTSTSSKKSLTLGIGSMNGTFSTALFGGVSLGTTYYVKTIDSLNKQITITATLGGSTAVTLTTKSGSMNLAEVGWDHVNPGTPIEVALDNSSVYFIEPKATFSEPEFSQTATEIEMLSVGTSWVSMAYGDHYWIALPSGNSTAGVSSDGEIWDTIDLPSVQSWTSIAYGAGYWVAISSGGIGNSTSIYSNSNGLGWRTTNLPSASTWSKVAYGNNCFVAVTTTGAVARMSERFNAWVSASSIGISNITGLTYGGGKFVVVSSSGSSAYSTDGTSWTITSPLAASAWSDVTYGNGRFVAVASTSAKTAYSFDASTWYQSTVPILGKKISYGQGIFLVLPSTGSTVAYTSDSGLIWKKHTVTDDDYGAVSFGWIDSETSNRPGYFVTLSGRDTGSIVSAGVKTKGRAVITSGVITSISSWEPGSGYVSTPTVTFTDPNVTALATVTPRLSDGTLASPTFINRGLGYNTNSTSVVITGNGYADIYQTGLSITINNLTRLPQPGDNLTFTGIDQIYKVTNAVAVFGTEPPNLEANVEISPDMSVALSPENGVTVSIRAKYSQARLTNHDFLNIGYGDFETSNYPGIPDTGYTAYSQNQTLEVNFGRVFYTSTDQDGNFKVGNLFGVQQATGIVTLSATQFGLTGLTTLSLGGIAVGGSSVVITQFSTDASFTANSDTIIPTQKAIKAYLAGRLTQGGSNTFTGQLIAGTVSVGGPDRISSTVPNGTAGSVINMPGRVEFSGSNAGVDGGMAALDYFVRGFTRRGDFI